MILEQVQESLCSYLIVDMVSHKVKHFIIEVLIARSWPEIISYLSLNEGHESFKRVNVALSNTNVSFLTNPNKGLDLVCRV